MSAYFSEPLQNQVKAIESALVVQGILLGVDWNNPAQVRQLMRDLLARSVQNRSLPLATSSGREKALVRLSGLVVLMLKVLRQGALRGEIAVGGAVWQVLSKALAEEHAAQP